MLDASLDAARMGFGGGNLGSQSLDHGLGLASSHFGLFGSGPEAGQALGHSRRLALEVGRLGLEPGERAAGILDDLALAGEVGVDPRHLGGQAAGLVGGGDHPRPDRLILGVAVETMAADAHQVRGLPEVGRGVRQPELHRQRRRG